MTYFFVFYLILLILFLKNLKIATFKDFVTIKETFSENLKSLAQKVKAKTDFKWFFEFSESWPWKISSPYVCIQNFLQKIQYLKS